MTDENAPTPTKKGFIFHLIAKNPWIFILFLPSLLTVFTAVGFTRDNYIEDQVGEIWIPTSSELSKDEDYLENLDGHAFRSSTIAAMAIARDSKNLFTESRLEEIRERMNAIEAMTVEMNNETFTWADICASNSLGAGTGTTYKWPCARLSPMDLFQETRDSYFADPVKKLTWYHGVVRGAALRPRILRFGIFQGDCAPTTEACAEQARLRMSADYAEAKGYPREYANPLGLISDVGSLPLNHECRICIEETYEAKMDGLKMLVQGTFSILAMEFRKAASLVGAEDQAKMEGLATKAETILSTLTRKDVEDFYYYQVIRETYAGLGSAGYQAAYNQLITPETLPFNCSQVPSCPPFDISLQNATDALLRHADNTFSSVSTAGTPLPLWSEGDGTGYMFGYMFDMEADPVPVGGSGIDLSGDIVLDPRGYINVTSTSDWEDTVESNPVYNWFMAGVTEMTAHCGNGNLTGTNLGDPQLDGYTAQLAAGITQKWCTVYNSPYGEDGTATKQHFARMWYDLLLDSDSFLGLEQGEDDPYTWTLGTGCGYSLGGERYPYTGMNEIDVLGNASRELYFIDEGASIGVVDRNILIGDATPNVGDYNMSNPLKEVGVLQSIYAAMAVPEDIINRLTNCNRPGGPVDISAADAEDLLKMFKKKFDDVWSAGWDDDSSGEVQFVSFSDDRGVIGTTGEFLRDITLSNGALTAVSIIIIAVFSVLLMFSFDPVESRVLVTLFGVALVVLSYFASLGFAIMLDIKLNVSTAFTLPFILIGLGVDDMYIVLMALKKQKDYSEKSFITGMVDVIIPVTMTSVTNACMFAVMNISDVPAVYLTARVALIAVCFLYLTIIFCFPALCYLDMKRQQANLCDVAVCVTAKEQSNNDSGKCVGSWLTGLIYDRFYRPLFFVGPPGVRIISHVLLWLIMGALLGVSIWGITDRSVGLGLEDFFPEDHQANRWASERTENLASWSISMQWGALDYGDPDTQMKMIKQFEQVVEHPNIALLDTERLWMADLAVWTTRQCDANVARSNSDILMCGRDQVWPKDNSTCAGTWKRNEFGLREKYFNDGASQTCQPYEGGVCRPTSQMHPRDLVDLGVDPEDPGDDAETVWCPVFDWNYEDEQMSDEKLGFCIRQWRLLTGGSGNLVLEDEHGLPTECSGEYLNSETVRIPIPYSSGPTMFSFDLFSHEITVEMIEDTRAICDDNEELHCWVSGIPYHYWSQYIGISTLLLEIGGTSIAAGFAIAVGFLFLMLAMEGNHSTAKTIAGSLAGSLLIAISMTLSLVTVVGLSVLAGVNITGFSLISFVLSTAFSIEHAVHIVHRWMHAPLSIVSAVDRADYAMSFLMLPTFMSFVSSTIGVATLAWTEFEFTQVYFFRPLIVVMFVTYFYGCWWLPCALSLLDFDFLKLGEPSDKVLSPEGEREEHSDQEARSDGKEPTATETANQFEAEIET